jgi:hypothetical protein
MSGLFGKEWLAIADEAATSAELIANGVTTLAGADDYRTANYWQAFFALSGGFERSAKLALIVDAFANEKPVPTKRELKELGHGVLTLIRELDRISVELGLPGFELDGIQTQMLKVLEDFSEKLDRYYNFDVLTETGRQDRRSPVAQWNLRVTIPVIEQHVLRPGEQLPNGPFAHDLEWPQLIRKARRWERMYALRIARSIAEVMWELRNRAQGRDQRVPDLTDFYAIYLNDDEYFRSRKTWTIYH